MAVAVGLALAGVARPARAGLVKYLAGQAAAGTVEQIEPALARTLGDVGTVTGNLIDKTSTDVGTRLDQVDGILEKRILQVQLGASSVIDDGLDHVNADARQRITQVGDEVDRAIDEVDGAVAKQLATVNGILTSQVDHVGGIVTASIDQADQAISARLEQLDEIAGRRLGNVDVIATKQRLAIERTVVRLAWLIGLVMFVVLVLKALWTEYDSNSDQIAGTAAGGPRARKYLSVLAPPLLKHAAVAGVVAGLLATVPQRLPLAATKDEAKLVASHTQELAQSVAALDWTETRFHASQLEFLDQDNTPRYRVMEAKADLLRDLLGRPTCLSTDAGRAQIVQRIETVERLASGELDPDAATARAMVLWKQGDRRQQEHQAATLAARALRASPRGFTLSPMAQILVEAYLHAPDPDEAGSESADLEPSPMLAAALAKSPPPPANSPFEGAVALFELMQTVDADSSAAFIDMVEAQAAVARLKAAHQPYRAELAARNRAADQVVAAWESFDAALGTTPALAGNPVVLQVFRLDDVPLSHALWFRLNPATTDWPGRLADLPHDKPASRLKLAIAPARVAWARRYSPLMAGPVRTLLAAQESQRYEALEQATLDFEGSYAVATGAPPPPAWSKAHHKSADDETNSLQAANAAAALGLYGRARSPLALELSKKVAANVGDLRKKLLAATARLRENADQKAEGAKRAVDQLKIDLLNSLLGRLADRGTRLI